MKMELKKQEVSSFTLIELLVVIAIIGLLAGLLLAAAGGVRNQASRNQARTEIAALEAALIRFQTENGIFPGAIEANPASSVRPTDYVTPGQRLFTNLLGRTTFTNLTSTNRSFFEPKIQMVMSNVSPNYFIDPWGNPYGYYWDVETASSVFSKAFPDIWSTAGQNGAGKQTNRAKWISNWPN